MRNFLLISLILVLILPLGGVVLADATDVREEFYENGLKESRETAETSSNENWKNLIEWITCPWIRSGPLYLTVNFQQTRLTDYAYNVNSDLF